MPSTMQRTVMMISLGHQDDRNDSMSKVTIYRAKCTLCKHEWTSRAGYGVPNCCPKTKCRSPRIEIKPIG